MNASKSQGCPRCTNQTSIVELFEKIHKYKTIKCFLIKVNNQQKCISMSLFHLSIECYIYILKLLCFNLCSLNTLVGTPVNLPIDVCMLYQHSGIVFGVKWVEWVLISWDFHTKQSLECLNHDSVKNKTKKKHPVNGSSADGQRRTGRLAKALVTQITTLLQLESRKPSQNAKHIKSWATKVKDCRVLLLSAKNRNLRLTVGSGGWENIVWSHEPQFFYLEIVIQL